MRLGASLKSRQPGPPREALERIVARAAAVRAAGLDSVFLGDHHATGPAGYLQNVPTLGRLLGEWDERPAGGLFLLPLWHPVLLAEQVGTLAAIARGPFVLQCAVGDGEAQFAAMGAEPRRRARDFEAALDVIRRLLAGEQVDADEPLRIRGARIAPLPPEPVAIWIGGHADAAVDRAARLGDAWIAGPGLTLPEAGALLERYRERCAAHGRSPQAVLRRDVYVGEDAAEARAVADPVLAAGYRGFDPGACVTGSVTEVVEQLSAYAELGFDEVLVRHLTDDQERVLTSFARLARVRAALVGEEGD